MSRTRLHWSGHAWTLWPHLTGRFLRDRSPATSWSGAVADPERGSIRLFGRFQSPIAANDAVIIVHGMGGSEASSYCRRAEQAARSLGMASLRLSLRGACRTGEDLYHAGGWTDVQAAMTSPELAGFARIYALGYSLGGHTVLRLAMDAPEPRLVAVAAVCAPLDLRLGQRWLDENLAPLYRRYLLNGLIDMYRQVAAVRTVPTPLSDVERIVTIRDWDRLAIAPRHGFASPEDYYARESAATRLSTVRVPTLLISAQQDPLVPIHTIQPFIPPTPRFRWVACARGGHVGFPRHADLGLRERGTFEVQIMRWLRAARES